MHSQEIKVYNSKFKEVFGERTYIVGNFTLKLLIFTNIRFKNTAFTHIITANGCILHLESCIRNQVSQ